MSGTTVPSLRFRQTATLALVFGAVVAAGAATGAWGEPQHGAGRGPGAGRSLGAADSAGLAALTPDQARTWVEGSGDRWAAFYDPQQYAGLRRQLAGEYVGVGLWVERASSGAIQVQRVQQDAPAAHAGIRVGDRLEQIDGTPVSGLPVTEVVSKLRGIGTADPAGSAVGLGIQQGSRTREVTLHRRVLDADDVTVDHPAEGITRIAVNAFSQGVGDEVQAAVQQVVAEQRIRQDTRPAAAPSHPPGILLDLRGNSGGLLAEAVESASAFLDGGPVGTYRTTAGAAQPLVAGPGGDTATPLVVLVDGGTMSAAELLTGALQDRGRAVVVGATTFGKGTVQEPTTLPGGSVVERTVGRYTTPGGTSPDGTGIAPDVAAPDAATPAEAQQLALSVLDGLRAALPGGLPANSGASGGRGVRE